MGETVVRNGIFSIYFTTRLQDNQILINAIIPQRVRVKDCANGDLEQRERINIIKKNKKKTSQVGNGDLGPQ